MVGFFKVLGRGVLYTVLLPFILVFWALYAVYCVFVFIIMAIRTFIIWISGGTPNGDLKEDVEAKRILLAQQNPEPTNQPLNQEQLKSALLDTFNTVIQQANQAQQAQQIAQEQKPQQIETPIYDVFPTDNIDEKPVNELDQLIDEQKKEDVNNG